MNDVVKEYMLKKKFKKGGMFFWFFWRRIIDTVNFVVGSSSGEVDVAVIKSVSGKGCL